MPKKKAEPDPPVSTSVEPRTTRRAASRAALQNMARLSASAYIDDDDNTDPSENYDPMTDDDETAESHSKRKKYSLSHRKSSDGNDRDVLVLKTISADKTKPATTPAVTTPAPVKEKPVTTPPPSTDKPKVINWDDEFLKLDAWAEELSPIQQQRQNRINKEIEEINAKIEALIKESGSEVIYQGENSAAYEITTSSKKSTKDNLSKTGTQNANNNNNNNVQLVMDPRSGVVVGTVTQPTGGTQLNAKNTRRRSGRPTVSPSPPAKVTKTNSMSNVHSKTPDSVNTNSPSNRGVAAVVDLTSDDTNSGGSKPAADSREIAFNKLQGKTFPSLVVVARPHLRVKDIPSNDRSKLDAKVKAVLMHVPTKFTEWLIQQGLIKSEQNCTTHPNNKLKLGMYSDVSKFPFSGGYVWISECCPQRFVSVFSGSLFEGSPHAPSVILKLIYHWACQTNVQNVVQWVKVDNLYVKGLNTWLRAACTVALHTHIGPLGGPGCKVEVGVISLGTTSQDGNQRQVKVEVLGLLETDAKRIRLRAVEPLADGDRNYKKRFSKILEPLLQWVHSESIIVTDLTVDKSTLHSMGFKNVQQSTSSDSSVSNHTIMEYLRRIVPRMFQNTLSLLSRQIIQQFLDELVWREWYGVTAAQAFDNIVLHLSEQTRTDTGQSLIMRLNKVATYPFKNWTIKHYGGVNSNSNQNQKSNQETTSQKRTFGKGRKQIQQKAASPQPEIRIPRAISPDVPKQMVPLENYYYGTIETKKEVELNVILNFKCSMCKGHYTNNIKLMDHLYTHTQGNQHSPHQCHYCLSQFSSKDSLINHIQSTHPTDTRFNDKFACLLCEITFDNSYLLGEHMSKEHCPSELPYLCGTCGYRCSSHKQAIDHFYLEHDGANTLQCPFCLKSTTLSSNGRMIVQNMHFFVQHVNKHLKKVNAKKCSKCNLWFVQKEFPKEHYRLHESVRYDPGLQPWPVPKANAIMVPKSELDYSAVEEKELDLHNVIIDLPYSLKCRECSKSMKTNDHFPTLQSCPNSNCRYTTCCLASMQKHITTNCKDMSQRLPKNVLPFLLYCVCGYTDNDGYSMAKHLAICERKSAYPSTEAAKAATVTRSMLDVLGLVRRPEEPATSTIQESSADKPVLEVMEIDSEDESDKQKGTKENDTSAKKDEEKEKIDQPAGTGESVEPPKSKKTDETAAVDSPAEVIETDALAEDKETDALADDKGATNEKENESLPNEKETEVAASEKEADTLPKAMETDDAAPGEKESDKLPNEMETKERAVEESEKAEGSDKAEESEKAEESSEAQESDTLEKSSEPEESAKQKESDEADDRPEKPVTESVDEPTGTSNSEMEEATSATDEQKPEGDRDKSSGDVPNEVLEKDKEEESNVVEAEGAEKMDCNSIGEEIQHSVVTSTENDEKSRDSVGDTPNKTGENQVQSLNDEVAEILENSINQEKQTPMDVDSNLDEIFNTEVNNLVDTEPSC